MVALEARDMTQWRAMDARLPVFLAFAFAVACTVLPILAHLYLPLVDLPNHIARLHIAGSDGNGPLGAYYDYNAVWVPNAAVDLVWRALGAPGEVERFANLVMALYAVNFTAAAMVLARVLHGRWTIWSAAAALLVFNGPFYFGFQNFVFSLPFVMYGLALWLALEGRAPGLRWLLFVPAALALYLMHLFAFGILATAVFGREIQLLIEARDNRLRRTLHGALAMTPFLAPIAWLAVIMQDSPEEPVFSVTEYGGLKERHEALLSPFVSPNAAEFPLIDALGLVTLAVLAGAFATLFLRRGPRLVLQRRAIGPVLALAVLAMLAPDWLRGVAWVHIRVPVMIVALLIAGSSWRGVEARQARILTASVALVIAAKGVAFERFAATHDFEVRDMLAVTETLPGGARVLPLRGPGRQQDRRFYHVQALLVPAREVFVPTLFQHVHALQLRPEWKNSAHPELFAIDLRVVFDGALSDYRPVFAENWENKFTHVLLVDDVPLADPRLSLVDRAGRFSLFEVHR